MVGTWKMAETWKMVGTRKVLLSPNLFDGMKARQDSFADYPLSLSLRASFSSDTERHRTVLFRQI
ncbi:MAG: hypothetical protein EBU88_10665 [Acidobacteria bacterium]|nr:hypothetical protein [Acidobacteriota bacterium]